MRVTATFAARHMGELLSRAAYGLERIEISRKGKVIALLVPVEAPPKRRRLRMAP